MLVNTIVRLKAGRQRISPSQDGIGPKRIDIQEVKVLEVK
jgi:hypothetical protein